MRARSATALVLLLAGLWALRAGAAAPKVFIETEVEPRDPYVQAAARVTVRVYSAKAPYRFDLDLPAPADALVRQLGGDDHGTARRAGRAYDVLTRRYLVFAQRSGKLTLAGARFTAQILTSTGRSSAFNGAPYAYGALSVAVEPLVLRGETIVLNVRPRPAGSVTSYWMPARHVSLTSSWRPESSQARVGDALTLTVAVLAEGLPAEQLPDLATLLRAPLGLKAYPEEPKLENLNRDDTLVGRREQSIALIADQPGGFTLPAITLRWWDTAHNLPQELAVPAKRLLILPALTAASAPLRRVGSAPGAVSAIRFALQDPWRWVSLALALAWLTTLGLWYGSRRGARAKVRNAAPDVPSSSTARSRARFLDACRANDPRAARRHLLAWAGATWTPAPGGLNGMARSIEDPELALLLRDLDRACYAGGPWHGAALARGVASLSQSRRAERPRGSALAQLYR